MKTILVHVGGFSGRRLVVCLAVVWASIAWTNLSGSVAQAQEASGPTQHPNVAAPGQPPADDSAIESKPGAKSEAEKEIEKQEQSQRVLGVLPMFGVTSRQNAPPLTANEKFRLFARSAFDPVVMGMVSSQAALSQAENEFPGYGQGMQGYGKRFGATLADEVSSGFWSNYFYPVLLKEDPRYFRLGEGTSGRRLWYAVKQEFVCHKDSGGKSFNYSNVLGSATAGAVSNLYYPGRSLIHTIPATPTSPAIPVYEDDRGMELTLTRSAISLAYGTMGGVFAEFWPDLRRKFFHKHTSPIDTPIP